MRMMLWIRFSLIHLQLMVKKPVPTSSLDPSPILLLQFIKLSEKMKMPLWPPFKIVCASMDALIVSLLLMLVSTFEGTVVIISPNIYVTFGFPFGNLKPRNRTRVPDCQALHLLNVWLRARGARTLVTHSLIPRLTSYTSKTSYASKMLTALTCRLGML